MNNPHIEKSSSSSLGHIADRPLLSAALPFPPLSWWRMAVQAGSLWLDREEPYRKMTFRNRYYLTGAQGRQMMSIPLRRGRNQRVTMEDVRVDDRSDWRTQHWKTLNTLYRRSPFFLHFADDIAGLLHANEDRLFDWNLRSIEWIIDILDLQLPVSVCSNQQLTAGSPFTDIRTDYVPQQSFPSVSPYYQVFQDKTGFVSDCSILDLLFCEGRYARHKLTEAKTEN